MTGVSGSGKSTLLKETLYKRLQNLLLEREDPAGACKRIDGWEGLDRVLEVDHSPIGYTPRSVPVLLCGVPSGNPSILLSMTPRHGPGDTDPVVFLSTSPEEGARPARGTEP